MNTSFRQTILLSFCLLFFVFPSTYAQDSLTPHRLLKQIEEQQLHHDPFFMPGIFPSYVSNKKMYREQRKDNNVFYTALIAYTLKTIRPHLATADQQIVDSIAARSERSVLPFKSAAGRETYNFWRTDSAYRLPYLWGMRIVKKNMLDDDQDCTSMCLLSLNAPAAVAQKAHGIMQQYANDKSNPTRTTFSRYRSYGAYSTWLGDRLPVVFDICVLSNVLTFVQSYNLAWTAADSASLDLIVATLDHGDHVSDPVMVAPYYGSSAVILYHLARLMSIKPIPVLEQRKAGLVDDAKRQLQQTHNEFEKILLGSALMKWKNPDSLEMVKLNEIEKNDLPFFIGNISSIFNLPLRKPLSRSGIGFYYHYCPAYNNTLLLEWLVLKDKVEHEFVLRKNF